LEAREEGSGRQREPDTPDSLRGKESYACQSGQRRWEGALVGDDCNGLTAVL